MQTPNRSALNQNDIMAGDVTVVASTYVKIGSTTIPAGIYRGVGYGMSASQADAQGRIYCKMQNATPAELTGTLRVSIWDPQDRPMEVIDEWPTAALNSSATDRTKQIPLPFDGRFVGKDYKIVFEFKSDTSDTLKKANTTIQLDMTNQLIN